MKKLLITLMIVSSIGLISCNTNDMNNPTTNNPSAPSSDLPNTDDNSLKSDVDNAMEVGKEDVNKLYTDLKNEIERQKENLNSDEWEKFKTDFNEKLTTVKDKTTGELREATDNLANLFDKYDVAIKDKVNLVEVKADDLKNKIEEILNK